MSKVTNLNKLPLLKVEHACKYFRINKKETLKAVDDVSFEIYQGETVGLVGESGCGKSTLGRLIVRLYDITNGDIYYKKRKLSSLTKQEKKEYCKQVQMIFQNPYSSLNPRMTVREIVAEGMKEHEMYSEKEIEEKVEQLLHRVGLSKEHMSRFAHEFSGGQRQRIGIARALSVNPEFIVCDEPISALDVSIQAQVINMLKNLQKELNLTYLFIAHDLSVVRYISDRVIVMYLGTIVEEADTDELYKNPQHPYTQALLSSIPVADPLEARTKERIPIKGEIPSPINPKQCCRFAERCPYAIDKCKEEFPQLKEVGERHRVACHIVK